MRDTELIRIVSADPSNFSWFLGAGTSRTAGLPTATDIIWDLKHKFYCREENLDVSRLDLHNTTVRSRIQSFCDSRDSPESGASDEYTYWIEKTFGDDSERQRQYFSRMLTGKHVSLCVGHRAFGALLVDGHCRVAFTTNFDSVVEDAFAAMGNQSLSTFHLEGSRAANSAVNSEDFPFLCKLHGDFRFEGLKNLESDLKQQNEELSRCLVTSANRFGFVVIGYSGRDDSVIRLFHRALESHNPFPHGFYWTVTRGIEPLPAVSNLITKAREIGVEARVVETQTYDAFMLQVWRNIDQKSPDLDSKVRKSPQTKVDIPLHPISRSGTILRLNALPIDSIPKMCHDLIFAKNKEWDELRQSMVQTKNGLILTKSDKYRAWGPRQLLHTTFGSDLAGIDITDVPEDIEASENFHLKQFFQEALGQSFAKKRPLLVRTRRRSTFLIVDSKNTNNPALAPLSEKLNSLCGSVPRLTTSPTTTHPRVEQVQWAESLEISVNRKHGRVWLLIQPNIWIWPSRSRRDAAKFMQQRRRSRLNRQHNEILDAWLRVLFGNYRRGGSVEVSPFDSGDDVENPQFVLGLRTAFSRKLQK